MAEPIVSFVNRRRPGWEALDALLLRGSVRGLTLEQLRELDLRYREASADLARAQADYPGSEAHRYLNQLCARAYAAIYRPRRDVRAGLKSFFARELPQAVRAERRFVLASAWMFLLAVLLGALVVLLEPRGAELLVPSGVRDAVHDGRLWTDDLLSIAPPGAIASGIATNNLTVMISTFAGGILLGLGTVLLLAINGLSIGATFAFAAREGLGEGLGFFVGAHGPVELSVLVLAGAAGLILGHALIDPGEQTRADRLRDRAQVAIRLVLGAAPFLAGIALVEGYVSPGDFFPGWVRVTLGAVLGVAFWSYLLLSGRETPPNR